MSAAREDSKELLAQLAEWREQRLREIGPGGFITVAEEVEARARIKEENARRAPIGNPSEAVDFYARNAEPRREIIGGDIREQQIGALAGDYGIGKSPLLEDIAVHLVHGIPWCGRKVERRPVIHFDLETPGPVYKANVRNISAKLGVQPPRVPEELDAYLEHDALSEPNTEKLMKALETKDPDVRLKVIHDALEQKPDALVIIDPLELLFPISTGKKDHVLWLYGKLRRLLAKFPHSAAYVTFNLRKWDAKRGRRPDLLVDPRGWLTEVCGTLDILNRCDVRMGMDFHCDEVRVINGFRRGEEAHPLLVRPVNGKGEGLAGFELCLPDALDMKVAFTPKQLEYWDKVPARCRFDEIADRVVPRSSLKRLFDRAKSLGLIAQESSGVWVKGGFGGT